MYTIPLAILTCFIIFTVESIPTRHPRFDKITHDKVRLRFRRREFVQEEVRKTMLNYMTSIKGEIADIVLDEMIEYYNSQTSKLYHLEKELVNIKNSSLPRLNVNTTLNDLVLRMSKQQHSFASNISFMEYKLKNLTNILNDLLNELQQKPVQHVRRLVSTKKNFENIQMPIGKWSIHVMVFLKLVGNCCCLDCDDVLRQQPSLTHEGIFRIKPRFASESFDVKCIFENNTGEMQIWRRTFRICFVFY